ncbi:MAG: pyridoxamine 5'-phosphate oxidase family protein [Defluviitaleaceae bacterium]|nr:pyridoxamine 5'-phosphate oxidase family protein [Defluviitaleaceae bacterium]
MRRRDRQIENWGEIVDVLRRADTIRLGINGNPFPYVVPLSFGFEEQDGQIVLYVHGAKDGMKHEMLDKNNHICVEAGIFHRYAETGTGVTAHYESVIGFGTAEVIYGDEAVRGLDLICTHCGYDGYAYDTTALERMRMYKIVLSSVTGKQSN